MKKNWRKLAIFFCLSKDVLGKNKTIQEQGVQHPTTDLKAAQGIVKNYILYMACFRSEDSHGEDRTAEFGLVYEIRASKARLNLALRSSPRLSSLQKQAQHKI